MVLMQHRSKTGILRHSLVLTCLFWAGMMSPCAGGGEPESPAPPDSPASSMYTIEDVYMVLTARTNVSRRAGTYGYNDWRLPNIFELLSLIDYSQFGYAMAEGYPFTNLQTGYYWASTSTSGGGSAWATRLFYGITGSSVKTTLYWLLPVRGRGERVLN